MSTKHTPGPWRAHYSKRFENYSIFGGGKSTDAHWICITKCESTPRDHEANARLIAAAPELLEAAQVALNYIENTESELGITLRSGDMLRAAIAKAVQS
jgi:hypothetical protein